MSVSVSLAAFMSNSLIANNPRSRSNCWILKISDCPTISTSKMNARGKPLTAFETFKARYEEELKTQFEGETRSIGDGSCSVAEFFSRRMDTTWADFFWAHRNTKTGLYDEAVMNLFRVVALLSRDPDSDSYLNDISALRDRQVKSSYHAFHSNEWLDRDFSELLILLLEAWSSGDTDFLFQLPDKRFF